MNISKKEISIILGPLAFFLFRYILVSMGCPGPAAFVGGTAVWMCIWWFSEAMNFGITALVPLLMFPLSGICSAGEVASRYTDSIIFLFFGGFMLAFAIEKWGLHHRLALNILSRIGGRPAGILFGVMLCAFLLSNWISNTATTIMLFGAVTALLEEISEWVEQNKKKFEAGILLGLAFAATIGGMATPIGTPPNMFFFNLYQRHYAGTHDMNFLEWMKIGLPAALIIFIFTFGVLYIYFVKGTKVIHTEKSFFLMKKKQLGKWKKEEVAVAAIFIFCIWAWVFRADIPLGSFTISGWQHWHPVFAKADDSTVAILAALLLFILPSSQKGKKLLEWEDAKKIRYDIILMFGSGFALAYGFEVSRLNEWISGRIVELKMLSPLIIVLVLCCLVTLISEFASNIASVQLCLPLLMPLHKELGLHPLLLMVPVTLASSVGFVLPVATAANTIVFGSGKINIGDMFRVGWILDIFCILCIGLIAYIRFS
ncbi:MAG: SLC13 family permease [Bacteroidia bacterium]|nr:SLC13 family permease [Bacteroidia bacterium]